MKISDIKQITENFVNELREAEAGRKTSLPYIEHTLASPVIVNNESFQVLVIGGSIYQTATCVFQDGKLVIQKRTNGDKPTFNTKEDLLTFVDSQYEPSIDVLAINFAYPLQPVTDDTCLDGILTHAVKENAFTGLIGEPIGKVIAQFIQAKYQKQVKISVANDTICTLLSGLHLQTPEELACGIVGTGVNFAYFKDELHPVNLESGSFDKFPQSTYGKIVDQHSVTPGHGLFEKETSGAYLYQHFNRYAEEHGLQDRVMSTKELDMFAKTCNGSGICTFTQNLLDNAAAYVAAQVAGITLVKQRDMSFVMAGSIFWRAWTVRESVERIVQELVPEHRVTFMPIENCEIYGAAKLVG